MAFDIQVCQYSTIVHNAYWLGIIIILSQRKFIDCKKTKLFHFRWNWDEEKKLRGIRLQISFPPPPPTPASPLFVYDGGSGQDFVDTIIALKML